MSKTTLYMMMGVPGAGKTSVAEIIADLTGAIHINSDSFRQDLFGRANLSAKEHQELYSKLDAHTERLLAGGESAIYDANLNRHIHRAEKYEICEKTGASPQLIWIQTPDEIARARATEQAHLDKKRRPFGNMPVSMFDRIQSQIEPPGADEAHIEIEGSRIDEAMIKKTLGV